MLRLAAYYWNGGLKREILPWEPSSAAGRRLQCKAQTRSGQRGIEVALALSGSKGPEIKDFYSETPALVSSPKELLRRGASLCGYYFPMDDRWTTWTFICQS